MMIWIIDEDEDTDNYKYDNCDHEHYKNGDDVCL